jgi:hypothetical protein
LAVAYGEQRPEVVRSCWRGLKRAAEHLGAGDLARASVEAVSVRLPDLTPTAVAKLANIADLEKGGDAWENEPRIPAGQREGGQWTTGGATGAAATGESSGARRGGTAAELDHGVYHPDSDRPERLLTGGPTDAEEGFRHGIGGNEPPYDFTELSELFPGLKYNPGIAVPLAPIDSFLGISGVADAANLAASEAEYAKLFDQIRALDPSYRHDMLEPLSAMNWQGRNNTINDLLMDRAAAYYRVRGDLGPLQVETLRLLRGAVDQAYDQSVQEYDAGRLKVPATRELAIGNRVDELVRRRLASVYTKYGIHFGRGQNILINNRDVSSSDQSYRRPDARVGKVSFDWSLVFKQFSSAQIRGFFRADSTPETVVIIRPSRLGGMTSYAIARPPGDIRKADFYVPPL